MTDETSDVHPCRICDLVAHRRRRLFPHRTSVTNHWPRVLRVVRISADGQGIWAVVTESWRDDETWDILTTCPSKTDAFDYISAVNARSVELRDAGLA